MPGLFDKLTGIASDVKKAVEKSGILKQGSRKAPPRPAPAGPSTPAESGFDRLVTMGFADPRRLVTTHEVSQALGTDVDGPSAEFSDESIWAEFRARDHQAYLSVHVAQPGGGMPPNADAEWAFYEGEFPERTPVPDLGDAAFHGRDMLFVRKGAQVLYVEGRAPEGADLWSAVESIGRLAAERL
ncbi:MAG: hypothetical protein ACT4PO_15760 [Actinomycetota bacterium]